MAARIEAQIKPELLVWARETAGLEQAAVAGRLKLPSMRLASWEVGEARPTVAQLRKLATVYKRPLAIFFLPYVPPVPPTVHDFRKLPNDTKASLSSELLAEIRKARRRRRLALELAEDLGHVIPDFSLKAKLNDDPDKVAAKARELLGISLEDQQHWREPYVALRSWIAALENRGVLVFQTGAVKLKEMRGFSIFEKSFPAIILNAKDKPRGRLFTVMHELAHLMLHYAGLCDPLRVGQNGRTQDERVEVFCNRVAGSILVPRGALLSDPVVASAGRSSRWSNDDIKRLAIAFGVSREVILRRLLIIGRADERFYEEQRALLLKQYAKPSLKPGAKPIVLPHRKAVRDNGQEFTGLVLDAFHGDRITAADVADYLGVKLKHLDRITDMVRGEAS